MEKSIHGNPPDGWACYICGQYFKICRFHKVYVWRMGEWMATRSTSLEMVHAAIEAKGKPITDPREIRRHVTSARVDLRSKRRPNKVKSKEPELTKKSALEARNAMIERMRVRKNNADKY